MEDERNKGDMTDSFGASPESVVFRVRGNPVSADGVGLLVVHRRLTHW